MSEDFERIKMEGILWKWTNYWNGWQPRWFSLDHGVLAYYKSKEEVIQGCKGSIKMSVCEIIVNPSDITRLDLVIPAEQHFYLKAGTAQERQQWLVALGSAKASLSSRRRKDSTASSPDVLKTKKSELRLYCDLLMQQVHTVKSTAAANNHQPPATETLDEATSLLEATCDTFIKTLEDCMKLADANMLYEMPHQLITDSPIVLPPYLNGTHNLNTIKKQSNGSQRLVMQRSMSIHSVSCSESSVNSVKNERNCEEEDEKRQKDAGGEEMKWLPGDENEDEETWVDSCDNQEEKIKLDEIYEEVNRPKKAAIDTFFSTLEISFLNMKITNENGIPTDHFLKSCSVVNVIFDLFGSPIFVPMKMDVSGNLKKITAKYNANPNKFVTLQDIVLYELATQTHKIPNSGTDALLWLKRGLEFVYEFLLEFSRGNPDLKDSALNAYNKSLKQYHGWIVRGVISAATHTVPSRHEVLTKLALRPDDIHNPLYEEQIKEDASLFLVAMEQIISILNHFYRNNELDKKEVV